MSGIVCAIRGGPDSQPTIDRSIALAGETGLPLYFLFVVNLDFLSMTESSRVHTISKEMHQMGDFILLTAQVRAEEKGVAAKAVVRHGNVSEEIVSLCHEINAEFVVLGVPRGSKSENIFTHERFTVFIQHIEDESGARVVIAEEGEG